jgi:hypothetical protein
MRPRDSCLVSVLRASLITAFWCAPYFHVHGHNAAGLTESLADRLGRSLPVGGPAYHAYPVVGLQGFPAGVAVVLIIG